MVWLKNFFTLSLINCLYLRSQLYIRKDNRSNGKQGWRKRLLLFQKSTIQKTINIFLGSIDYFHK